MSDAITFARTAKQDLISLWSGMASRSDLKELAAALDDDSLTRDEFVRIEAPRLNGSTADAAMVFDTLAARFGDTVDPSETTALWQVLATGEGMPASAQPKFQLHYKAIGDMDIHLPGDTDPEPVGRVAASRAVIPLGSEMPALNDGTSPVHYLRCEMTMDAKRVGMTAAEFKALIARVEDYDVALSSVVNAQAVDAVQMPAGVVCAGGHYVFSDFTIAPAIHGRNVLCMRDTGLGRLHWSTRSGEDGSAVDLNDATAALTSWVHGSTTIHSNANTAGDWDIRANAGGGTITIDYHCVLQFPGGFGTGDSKSANALIDKVLYSQTMGMFTDIFVRMGPVYVELKRELAARGDARVHDPNQVIETLKMFYDKTATYEENVARMKAAL